MRRVYEFVISVISLVRCEGNVLQTCIYDGSMLKSCDLRGKK
jgi:hypothetical protein